MSGAVDGFVSGSRFTEFSETRNPLVYESWTAWKKKKKEQFQAKCVIYK